MQKVIYLEVDEEITSVVERIKKSEAEKVILVIPKRANLLQSIVNLKLLKREVQDLNKEVIIVTTDKLGRNLAAQVGFLVYQNLDDKSLEVEAKPTPEKVMESKISYREKEIPESSSPQFKIKPSVTDITYRSEESPTEKKAPSFVAPSSSRLEAKEPLKQKIEPVAQIKTKPRSEFLSKKKISSDLKQVKNLFSDRAKLFLFSGIGIILLLLVIGFVILPSATINLTLKGENTEKIFEVLINKEAKEPNFEKSILPGELVTLEREEIYKDLPCTGKKNIGQKASGTVRLFNAFDENPQQLIANTRLVSTTNGKTYRLTKAVTIPGARVSGGEVIPGTVDAEVVAEEPGDSYNINSSHFTIPGLSGTAKYDTIYADTVSAIRGGFTEEVTVLSVNDINLNRDNKFKEISKKLFEELRNKYKDKEVFTEGINPEIVDVNTNIPPNTESAKFDLKLKVKLTSMITDKKNFQYLTYKKLTANLSPNKDLNEENIKQKEIKLIEFDKEKGLLKEEIKGIGYVVDKLETDKLSTAIRGKNIQEAANYLSSLKGVSKVKIELWPFWVKSIPRFSIRKIKFNFTTEISD